jgi:hypothetical protein
MRKHVCLRCTRLVVNPFSVRTISKTKRTLHGAFMRTGAVRDDQQSKQSVYSIPHGSGRCRIGETGRPLHILVLIKEPKYNLTQCLPKNQN